MDLFVKSLKYKFIDFFFELCYFFLFITNLLFFYHLLYFHHSLLLWLFLIFSLPFLLTSFFLFLFVFTTLVFSTLVSTAFHTLSDILLSLSLLFSSKSQRYSKQAIASLKLHSIFALLLH